MFKVIDMFCGCGGMGLGFQRTGYEIPLAFDFDKYAVESYKANVGSHVQQRDITKLTAGELPYADVWAFGFPCQDLSVAGKQAGLFEGKRSGLFFEVMRLLDESTEKPKILLAENVKGLKAYLPILEREFKARGYRMYVQMFNSKYWDVPQNRERYYVVGIREDITTEFVYPTEQHEFVPRLSRDLETEVDEKYYYSEEKTRNIIDIALKKTGGNNPQDVFTDKDGVAYACNARYYKGASYADVLKSRNTQVVEPKIMVVARTEGYEVTNRVYDSDGLAPTLLARNGGGGFEPVRIIEPPPQIKVVGMLDIVSHDHSRRVHDPEGLSPTVTAVAGGTHHIKILERTLVPQGDDNASALIHSRNRGLETRKDGIGHCVKGAEGGSSKNHLVERTAQGYRVRKLTPTEYGRLQAFPMATWKQVVSNTQAYKQFGNAVTVTLAMAMAMAIKDFLEVAYETR